MRLLWVPLLLIIIFSIRVLITKDNLVKSIKLKKEYSNWLINSDSTKPSNTVFNNLLKSSGLPLDPFGGLVSGAIIKNNDLITFFPDVENKDVFKRYLNRIIDNFQIKYDENFSIPYWIKLVIFMPQKIVEYLGTKPNSLASKILNIIYWASGIVFLITKVIIKKKFKL